MKRIVGVVIIISSIVSLSTVSVAACTSLTLVAPVELILILLAQLVQRLHHHRWLSLVIVVVVIVEHPSQQMIPPPKAKCASIVFSARQGLALNYNLSLWNMSMSMRGGRN